MCADKEWDFVEVMETILFLKGIYPISGFSISCRHLLWIVTNSFFEIIGIEIETVTHLFLNFVTSSRFSRFLKDAIHCLDIPSRRPRDKYSQKSNL